MGRLHREDSPWDRGHVSNVRGWHCDDLGFATLLSIADDRHVEAALGELALDAVQLVDVVVGTEAYAIADRLVRERALLNVALPSRRARAAPSGSRRRPRSRTSPPAARTAPVPSPRDRPRRPPSAGFPLSATGGVSAGTRPDGSLSGLVGQRAIRRRRLWPATPSAPRRRAGSCRSRTAAFRRSAVRRFRRLARAVSRIATTADLLPVRLPPTGHVKATVPRDREPQHEPDEDAEQRTAATCVAAACTERLIGAKRGGRRHRSGCEGRFTSARARRCPARRARSSAPAPAATTSARRARCFARRRPGIARHYSNCGIPRPNP